MAQAICRRRSSMRRADASFPIGREEDPLPFITNSDEAEKKREVNIPTQVGC